MNRNLLATEKLLPQLSGASSLERRFVRHILKMNPGMGEKTLAIAASLADSGMPPSAGLMLLDAIYKPETADGRGQGTRTRWFVEAVRSRYAHRLEKAGTDYKAFRALMGELEEVVEMRDELNNDGYSTSFHAAFVLSEVGLTADEVKVLIFDLLPHLSAYPATQLKIVVSAAMAVKAGQFSTMEGALRFLFPNERGESDYE
jgi:hypothetical protein